MGGKESKFVDGVFKRVNLCYYLSSVVRKIEEKGYKWVFLERGNGEIGLLVS